MPKAPEYIATAEELIGTKFLYEPPSAESPAQPTAETDAAVTGMRGILYFKSLRLLARVDTEAEHAPPAGGPTRLARFALKHAEQISSSIARPLAIINAVERVRAERPDEVFAGLHDEQLPYMDDILEFVSRPPSKITVPTAEGEVRTHYIRGVTVEAPTGSGKTALMARTLKALGVGKPIEGIKNDQRPVRALIIVPVQTIVEQLTGKVGDDTLRTFAPDIDIGAYYQHDKVYDTDVVVITIEQFLAEFRNGQLHGRRFDACFIDETHYLAEPLFRQALL